MFNFPNKYDILILYNPYKENHMKIVIQRKNKKWYLGEWDIKTNTFTREKTYVKINGSGVKKEKLSQAQYDSIVSHGPKGILQAYAVKEEALKARGRKANPDKPKAPKKEELVMAEDMSDNKKEKAFEKIFWKVKHPTCIKCKKSCKQSAMVSLFCPVSVKA
jgi:hypothetical protein